VDVLWPILAGLFGLAIGSFLNVVICRVPAGLSVVSPPSACPKCGSEIRNRHNVPVVGWLVLRGRCYDCQAHISARYPVIEAVTGVIFVALTARLLAADRAWLLPACLYLGAVCLIAAMIALDRNSTPKAIVNASFAVVFALLLLAAAFTGDWWGLARAALATVVLGLVGLMVPRRWASTHQDARELAQLVAAPVAFISWWTLGYAAAATLVLVCGWAAFRRSAGSAAAVWCVACAAVAAVLLPVP
jgi:leader peptidase (prepilin peptidase)/N-methyltransferase